MRGLVVALFIALSTAVITSDVVHAQEPVSTEESTAAALVHLCTVRAEKLGLTDEVKIWAGIRQDYISDAALNDARAGLNAVEDTIANVDPAIITQRCDEGKAIFTAPDVDALPDLDPELEAINEDIQALIKQLNEELKISGYGPTDQAIILDHFVALSNHYGIDGVKNAGVESRYAYQLAIEAVRQQRAAFKKVSAKSKKGKALIQSSDVCIDVVSDTLFTTVDIASDQASSVAVRTLLFQGVKAHRRSIGGVENVAHTDLMKRLDASMQTLTANAKKDGKKAPDTQRIKDTLIEATLFPLCMKTMPGIVKVMVAEPLEDAEKKSSRKASK